MRTPSVRARLVTVGVLIVLSLAVAVDLGVYAQARSRLHASLRTQLDDRASLVLAGGQSLGTDDLGEWLGNLDFPVAVRTASGGQLGTVPRSAAGERLVARQVPLPDGAVATVAVSAAGTDEALSQLVRLEGAGTLFLLLLATILLWLGSGLVLRPLRSIAESARRTAAGERGRRLRPDRPGTEWGEVATAYDAMVDGLEAALAEAREAEARVEVLQRRAAIVDSAQEAVISADLDATIITWNGGAEELYGFTAEEAIGAPLSLIVPEGRLAEFEASLHQLRAGDAVRDLQTVRRCKDATLVDVSLSASPVYGPSGAVVGLSIISRDVTEQRWIARTLDETLGSLRTAVEQAQQAESRMRTFLDDAAHQLRGPLAGISAAAETLLRTASPAERDALLAAMVREVSRASQLVSRLLALARLDHDAGVTRSSCNIASLCSWELERLRIVSPRLNTMLRSELSWNTYQVDPMALREILGNLLDNARRHAATRVDILLLGTDDGVQIRVRDDGSGLSPDAAERVFERFVSLDGRGGSGLGLAIARGLARAHGGDLAYRDGAFVVDLSAAPATESAGQQVVAAISNVA